MDDCIILNAESTLKMPLHGLKLVEASAGTGKTYAIGNLFLRMLFEGYLLKQILVVTFTKAATEELRGRIRLRIYQALKKLEITENKDDESDEFLSLWASSIQYDLDKKKRATRQLKLALHSMDEAAIYTIHGFCQRALTEFAFHSRQAFDIEMISDDHQMWVAAIKDWWRNQAYTLNAIDLSLFTQALGTLDAFIELQRPLRKPGVKLLPEIEGELQDIYHKYAAIEDQFHALSRVWQQRKNDILEILTVSKALARSEKHYRPDKLTAMYEQWDKYFQSNTWYQLPKVFSKLTLSGLEAGSKPKQKGTDAALNDDFFISCQQYMQDLQGISDEFRAKALADASYHVSLIVSQLKDKANQLSFDDQLLLLQQALQQNEVLAEQLNKHFPVAMIDEFQDTDAIQYHIFKHIYHARDKGCMMMIGDPKQAIYSFRGGDIFTYMQAKKDAGEHYSLDTNWRSTGELIEAVNQLFLCKKEAFIYADIPFQAVHAAPKNQACLRDNGEPLKALSIWHIPLNSKGKTISKVNCEALMHAYTANEIVRLIQGGQTGEIQLGERTIQPSDIAILVRNHFEAAGVKQALSLRGINAVSTGNEKLLQSDEAIGLKFILAAVIDFKNSQALRLAMASTLLEYDYQTIYHVIGHEQQWLDWGEKFQYLHETWLKKGFMAMFQVMLRSLDIGERLAKLINANRRLTNILHLGELLQQASQSMTGMEALLHWFELELENDHSEAEMRLESDADLVRIVTIHSSKGLEYPVVFLPYMWSCKPRELGKGLLPFFDEKTQQHCLDLGPNEQQLLLAEKERLAEDVRLTYVALTRACAKIYMAWGQAGKAGNAEKTALAWLLHSQQNSQDLEKYGVNVFDKNTNLEHDLNTLAQSDNIELIAIEEDMPEMLCLSQADEPPQSYQVTEFTGHIATDWRISSFSSMTRDVHQNFNRQDRSTSTDAIFNFPAGRYTGLFLHALLEKIDFQHVSHENIATFSQAEAARYGLDDASLLPVLNDWLQELLHTQLNDQGLSLATIPLSKRLNELAFDFSICKMNIASLNDTLEQAAGQALPPLQSADYRGFMTGIIDLVFEYDGRYFLVDYKSNHLGFSLDAYKPEQLKQVMLDRRYDLQYLIYCLALHRYLSIRIPDYSYEKHFGGAYYLFLRGMRSEHAAAYGVYYERPSLAFIHKLDSDIFNAEVML